MYMKTDAHWDEPILTDLTNQRIKILSALTINTTSVIRHCRILNVFSWTTELYGYFLNICNILTAWQ